MRSFITALIILSVIIIMIVFSTVYVTGKTDELLALCAELENDSSAESVRELTELWQSCRRSLSLTVHQSKIEAAESAILSLNAYIDTPSDFKAQLSILTESIMHIAESQHFSFENIF